MSPLEAFLDAHARYIASPDASSSAAAEVMLDSAALWLRTPGDSRALSAVMSPEVFGGARATTYRPRLVALFVRIGWRLRTAA